MAFPGEAREAPVKLATSRPVRARRVEFACCVLLLLVLTTCSKEGPTGPTEVALRVSVVTTGVDIDPDGYSVALDGEPGRSVAVDGAVTFTAVTTGSHSVALAGIAGNCQLSGPNPRQV